VQEDGRLLFENAYPATDVLLTANHNRLVHTIVLKDAQSPADFRWNLEWPNGLRQVESSRNETSLVDADGYLRLTLREAIITGADGKVDTTQLVLARDGSASLRVDPLTLAYPAVIQFEVETPPIALAIIPPEIIKARMMVLVDSSGSMIRSFVDDDNQSGDSDDTAVFCDNNIGTGFTCADNVACSLTGATPGLNLFPANNPTGDPSRMLGTKLALQNVFNAHSGLIDFGLMRFREHETDCPDPTYCCTSAVGTQTMGRCTDGDDSFYPNYNVTFLDGCTTDASPANPGTGCDTSCNNNADGNGNASCNCTNDGHCDGDGVTISDGNNSCVGGVCLVTDNDDIITYSGQGTECSTNVGAGGRVLVEPAGGSAPLVREWVDFVEDFCSSTNVVGGPPRNPELRADGHTPLEYSIDTARTDWYQLVYNDSQSLPCADNGNPARCDDLIDCRPYVLVVTTDGDDTCGGDGSAAVGRLRSVNSDNPVTIYTLGMGDEGGLDTDELNAMATAGGSGQTTAPIAANQSEIEAAFADIVAETVKFEVCNALDDNCNNRVDEGLNVYQECTGNGDCGSSNCDLGRCGCTIDSQCANGYTCAADSFCRPACSVGVGVCRNSGIRKCGSTGGQCCIDDGAIDCTPLAPLDGTEEVCNRVDDDCDGLIDEDFPAGCPVCVPQPEVCNGVDDDCDTLVDGDDDDLVGVGAPCGTDEGVCSSGTINCVNGSPVCEGEDGGGTEVCNGLDDNCDGSTDGQTQGCYTGPDGTEDVGVCHGGTQACIAPPGQVGVPCTGDDCWGACVGEVTPTLEICDSQDNDCDAETDEGVPVEVQTCTDNSECLGTSNCVNDTCRCNSGTCAAGFECGGDNVCHPTDGDVTGDQCCQQNFNGLCGVGQCTFGEWTCTGAQVTCLGGNGPSNEVCDGLDNDCDGQVDEDLQGVGEACDGEGDCGGVLQCVVEYDDNDIPVGGTITCVPTGEGTPEVCDNIDNDCDGDIDELPDIVDNDPNPDLGTFGDTCEEPEEGMNFPPCSGGTWQCIAGQRICRGAILPGTEECDGEDNDCDGVIDEETCQPDGMCIDGACRAPCGGGEFPCPLGESCVRGYCVPSTGSGTNDDTSGGSGGTSATDGAAGADASGGSGTTDAGGTNGSGGTNASGNVGGAGGSQVQTNNASNITTTSGPAGDEDDSYKVYGLASGGGGCACRIGEPTVPGELALLLGLVTAGGVLRRRRHASPRSGS
jgi:hypothetical protein